MLPEFPQADYPQYEQPEEKNEVEKVDLLPQTVETVEKVEKVGKERRGFASMDREKQREIASKGGRAAHAKGTAHEFTADEARLAGSKGGKAVSQNREHMAAIGRKGGQARGGRSHS